jgi:hypothetical protein
LQRLGPALHPSPWAVPRFERRHLEEAAHQPFIHAQRVETQALVALCWASRPAARDRSAGLRNVLVAVVPTGFDLGHPDLPPTFGITGRESDGGARRGMHGDHRGVEGNNGIDDDHNGYVDDVTGVGLRQLR